MLSPPGISLLDQYFRRKANMHILLGIFALIVLVIVTSTHAIVKTMFEPKLTQLHQRFMRLSPQVLKDLEFLRQNPVFEDTTYKANAALTLEFFVSFEGGQSVKDADRVRDLFLKYPYWKTAGGQLKQLMEDPEFKSLDTKWVNELYRFDHWQLTAYPFLSDTLRAMARMNGIERVGVWTKLPVPNYNELRQWATLNFLKMQREGRPMPGLHAFRKVAQLAHTSGTLVGNMVAVAMLNDEEMLVEKFKVSGWRLMPKDVIQAYRRVSWAWQGIAYENWFGEFPKAFEPYLTSGLGACVMALEMNGGIPAFQDFLEPRFLFETSFNAAIDRVRAFQGRVMDICHVGEYKSAFGPTDPKANPLLKEDQEYNLPLGKGVGGLNYSRIPYLRRVLGMILMTIGVPDYFRFYDSEAKKTN